MSDEGMFGWLMEMIAMAEKPDHPDGLVFSDSKMTVRKELGQVIVSTGPLTTSMSFKPKTIHRIQ